MIDRIARTLNIADPRRRGILGLILGGVDWVEVVRIVLAILEMLGYLRSSAVGSEPVLAGLAPRSRAAIRAEFPELVREVES